MELKFNLILISPREVLAQAIHSLLHLSIGEESKLSAFQDFDEALEKAPLSNSDLLLLEADDQVLEKLHRVREVFGHGSVVVLTERADHDLGLACIRAGAHDYITLEEISPGSLFRSLRFAIERRKVQQALETSQSQLSQAQKMEAIGRMASGLAHDFRQYVQVIVGNSKVLQRLCKDDDTVKQLVQDIAQAGYGANELVGQVLDFAREGPGTQKELDLNEVVQSNRSMVESFGKKIRVNFNLAPQVLKIQADPVQLGQIILNLAINAVDACGGKGSVEVATRILRLSRTYSDSSIVLEPGNYAVLDVRDNGSGIPSDVREKLFDPFFTTKPRGKGTGLGLSTVYSLVHGFGGKVSFWTRVGTGTTFSAFLPSLDQSPAEITPKGKMSVGLLLGDVSLRNLMRQDMRTLRLPHREFGSVASALQWLGQAEDRRLILERGKALTPNCVVLTALLDDSESAIGGVLQKPYSLQALTDVLTTPASQSLSEQTC